MATASGMQGPKQTRGFFVPLGNCVDKIYQYNGAAGSGGSFLPGNFTAADWTLVGTGTSAGGALSTISSIGQGGLLKDMGKTVVSSNRTFRKVQLLVRLPLPNYEGVAGSSRQNLPFLTGYIELRGGPSDLLESTPAPVAYLPDLL